MAWGTNCIIGTSGVIPSLVTRRILGSSRRHVEAIDDLVPSKDLLLFQVEADGEFIRPGEDLQAFDRRPDATPPAEVLLFIHK